MTLGIDASTSVVGWAFSANGKVIDAGYIDISKQTTNKDKTFFVIQELEKNPNIQTVDHINLEAALSGFMGGGTQQQTIILLARFNAIFEYIISERWNKPVKLLNVSTMRKKVLGKARIKGMKGKDYVKEFLPKVVPNIKQFEKINKIGNWDKRNGDTYDAIVAALYD